MEVECFDGLMKEELKEGESASRTRDARNFLALERTAGRAQNSQNFYFMKISILRNFLLPYIDVRALSGPGTAFLEKELAFRRTSAVRVYTVSLLSFDSFTSSDCQAYSCVKSWQMAQLQPSSLATQPLALLPWWTLLQIVTRCWVDDMLRRTLGRWSALSTPHRLERSFLLFSYRFSRYNPLGRGSSTPCSLCSR